MAVDLAVALLGLAVSQTVRLLISGQEPTGDDWAGFAGGVTHALMTHAGDTSTTQDHSAALAGISRQLDDIPVREYEQHMAAGRRHLDDLTGGWHSEADRRDIIRDARGEFVSASAVAMQLKDTARIALTEIAIAGCWLLVPTLSNAQLALEKALKILEDSVLDNAGPLMVQGYIDVLALCQAYGAVPADWALPVNPELKPAAAALAVKARRGQWVYCLGVKVRLGRVTAVEHFGPDTNVVVEVTNVLWPEIKVGLSDRTPPGSTPAPYPVVARSPEGTPRAAPDPLAALARRLLAKPTRPANPAPPPSLPPHVELAGRPIPAPAQSWHSVPQQDTLATTLWTPHSSRYLAVWVELPRRRAESLPGPNIAFLIP